ncbi:MAG: hypothetical protein E7056_00745 [Lentisphaerae bacterium]|nr:hypothetical protein [Lentisphaerota bacterium]
MNNAGKVKMLAVLAVFSIVLFNAAAAESKAVAEQAQATECSSCSCEKNFYNMGRGLVNILTCWLEVPRCLVYHNSQVPVMGAVVGACEGAGLTAIRAFAGVADFLSFGFMTDSIYETSYDFREWVWDSRWIPQN